MADYSRNAHMHANALQRSLILVFINVSHITLYARFIYVAPKYAFWTLHIANTIIDAQLNDQIR